jgi:hypothetical protein
MGIRQKKRKGRNNIKLRTRDTIGSLPPELRGPSQNRFGGHQTQRLRGYRRTGKPGPGRRVTGELREAIEADLRKRGVIT